MLASALFISVKKIDLIQKYQYTYDKTRRKKSNTNRVINAENVVIVFVEG